MSEAGFNPYRKWLGIREDELPANYYRLLGIELFEEDSDVIDHAASRQMAHIRTFQRGQNAEASQRLLSELATAKKTLLKPGKRAVYDDALRAQLGAAAPAQAAAVPVTAVTPMATPVSPIPRQTPPPAPPAPPPAKDMGSFRPQIRKVSTGRRGSSSSNWLIILVVCGLIGLFVVGLIATLVVVGGAFYLAPISTSPARIELLPTPSDPPPVVVPNPSADPQADEPSAEFLAALGEARSAAVRSDVPETNAAMNRASRLAKTASAKAQLAATNPLLKALIRFHGYVKQGAVSQSEKPPFQFQDRFYQVFSYEAGVVRYSVRGGMNEKSVGSLPPADALAFAATVGPIDSESMAAVTATFLVLNDESDNALRSIGMALHQATTEAPSYQALQHEIEQQGWDLSPAAAIPAVKMEGGELPLEIPGLKIPGLGESKPADESVEMSLNPTEEP